MYFTIRLDAVSLMKQLTLQRGKGLVVVAHPDDETIWMGGTLLHFPNISWTIFALCRKDDLNRAPKFRRVAKFYQAHGIISDLEDEGLMTITESLPEIAARIRSAVRPRPFDYIFTHGPRGEYGHPRHRGVHAVVKGMTAKKELVSPHLFFFAYKRDGRSGAGIPQKSAEFSLVLSRQEWKTKRAIIKDFYGFKQSSFENRSCAKVETFMQFRVP